MSTVHVNNPLLIVHCVAIKILKQFSEYVSDPVSMNSILWTIVFPWLDYPDAETKIESDNLNVKGRFHSECVLNWSICSIRLDNYNLGEDRIRWNFDGNFLWTNKEASVKSCFYYSIKVIWICFCHWLRAVHEVVLVICKGRKCRGIEY